MPQRGSWFRALWVFDAIIAAIVVYFFTVGLVDGSVSAFNIELWLGILAGLAAVLGGSLWLSGTGRPGAANALLLVLAVPGLLYGLFMLLVIVTQPRWN